MLRTPKPNVTLLAGLVGLVGLLTASAAQGAPPTPGDSGPRVARHGLVARVPLAAVPYDADLSLELDTLTAEAAVRVCPGRRGELPEDLGAAQTSAIERRGWGVVVGVVEKAEGPCRTLHFLLSHPSVETRLTRSSTRHRWFLEIFTLQQAPILRKELELPIFRYADPEYNPLFAHTRSAVVLRGRETLVAVEDALTVGDLGAAQHKLDALGDADIRVRTWAMLLQADADLARGDREAAVATLTRLAKASRNVGAVLLGRARLAELTRHVGHDISPAVLLQYARQRDKLPDFVMRELLARRVRGLYLEGRWEEAIESYRELVRRAADDPVVRALVPLVRTCRYRAVRTAYDKGDHLAAAYAATALARVDPDGKLERRVIEMLADSYKELGLHANQIKLRLQMLLRPLSGPETARHLVDLALAYLAGGKLERARMTAEFLRKEHARDIAPTRLHYVDALLARQQGAFERSLASARLALADPDMPAGLRLSSAILAWRSAGAEPARKMLEPLQTRGDGERGIRRETLARILDGARAQSGRCTEMLGLVGGPQMLTALADPSRAYLLAHCARTQGGHREALTVFEALATSAPPLIARAASAEARHLRWEFRNAEMLARFGRGPAAARTPTVAEQPASDKAPKKSRKKSRKKRRKPRRRGS